MNKQDKIRGSLIGGAAGDALGYEVEFLTLSRIYSRFGESGITQYVTDDKIGYALISDDTQMTLFTANGILTGETEKLLKNTKIPIRKYIEKAYRDWYCTQSYNAAEHKAASWIYSVPELHCLRAPGNTCLSALRQNQCGSTEKPINSSKGCGGIMRTAPMGLYYDTPDKLWLVRESAEASALTHGHSLGYLSSAVFAYIINAVVYGEKQSLEQIVSDALAITEQAFEGNGFLAELRTLTELAVKLSKNSDSDTENIKKLGEGWVAEETLAIAVYCSLKYENDFSRGIIAAVNHDGDSDSTGAVTGNILGAIHGYNAIDEKWKTNLELKELILEIADDLSSGCKADDDIWVKKYLDGEYCL